MVNGLVRAITGKDDFVLDGEASEANRRLLSALENSIAMDEADSRLRTLKDNFDALVSETIAVLPESNEWAKAHVGMLGTNGSLTTENLRLKDEVEKLNQRIKDLELRLQEAEDEAEYWAQELVKCHHG